jgi:hypothetical protein
MKSLNSLTEAKKHKLPQEHRLDNVMDILINSMEHYELGDFVDALKQHIGLTDKKLAKQIFDEYWNVDAKARGSWDIKEWEKWLSKYIDRIPK